MIPNSDTVSSRQRLQRDRITHETSQVSAPKQETGGGESTPKASQKKMANPSFPRSHSRTTITPRLNLYATPRTSSYSTSSTPFEAGTSSRKRQRRDSDNAATQSAITPGWSKLDASITSLASPGAFSPAPLANSRYTLAGGLDTPGAALSNSYEENFAFTGTTPEAGFRRGRGWSNATTSLSASTLSYFPHQPRRNGSKPISQRRGHHPSTTSTYSSSWSSTLFSAFSSATNKIWSFCKAGAFRGFYAGGGQGYALEDSNRFAESLHLPLPSKPLLQSSSVWQDESEADNSTLELYPKYSLQSSFQNPQIQTPPPSPGRPTKRLLREGDLNSDWVMIPPGENNDSRESSPSHHHLARKPSAASLRSPRSKRSTSPSRRPSLVQQPSYVGGPTGLLRTGASAASMRSPLPSPEETEHELQLFPRPRKQPRVMSNHRRSKSALQPNSYGSSSPLSPEIRKFQANLRKKEDKEDRELRAMNERLTALIREGRQALGSTVEVLD